MKETTKMSRAVGQLEKIYNTLNADLFGGALPVPIITVQSKPGTYGHCTTSKVWKNKDSQQYEMNIAAEMLSVEIEEVLDTLIHEMIHLYCRENGIQEVSRGGYQRISVPAGGTQSSSGAAMQPEGGKRPSSTRKYQCPCCKNSVRATKTVNLICGDCMEKMVVAE